MMKLWWCLEKKILLILIHASWGIIILEPVCAYVCFFEENYFLPKYGMSLSTKYVPTRHESHLPVRNHSEIRIYINENQHVCLSNYIYDVIHIMLEFSPYERLGIALLFTIQADLICSLHLFCDAPRYSITDFHYILRNTRCEWEHICYLLFLQVFDILENIWPKLNDQLDS